MTRLIDHLLRERLPDEWRHYISGLPVIVIDNVAQYYYASQPPGPVTAKASDFPNLAPPFAAWWMEFRAPPPLPAIGFEELGWICEAEPWGDGQNSRFLDEMRTPEGDLLADHDITWHVAYTLVVGHHHGRVSRPLWTWRAPVNGDGSLYTGNGGDDVYLNDEPTVAGRQLLLDYSSSTHGDEQRFAGSLQAGLRGYLYPALLALSFLHCKNVVMLQRRPEDWQQKVALRKHKRPLVTYHVLNIEPMKTVLKTEGDVAHSGLKRALHICRGHFKTYTPAKPLFGRVTGTFWWEARVRGLADVGLALKDYNVKPPVSPKK